jgi:leader peptidase (prepilin peptidase)/N-methyltransferase
VVGASIGSFLGVVGWRWRRSRDVVIARSVCDQCDHVLAAWEIVPVVSWLVLRRRCRHCDAPISPRHLVVEVAAGLLTVVSGTWLL